MKISIDIETFSSIDLKSCGVYKYAESPDFEILLFGYSIDDGPVTVIDIARGEKLPEMIIEALLDEHVLKWAHNSSFERVCISSYLRRIGRISERGKYLSPKGWRCTMVWAAYLGLPFSLKDVGGILKLDQQKLESGKSLIRYFCVPVKQNGCNGKKIRNLPEDDLYKWGLFKEYNIRDVQVENEIQKKLSMFPIPEFIWDEYCLDQYINDRGVLVDMKLVDQAIKLNEKTENDLMKEMKDLTGLENPNSVVQLKRWLREKGIPVVSLAKKEVTELIEKTDDEDVRRVLTLRLQLSKSSVKKYTAMKNVACQDDRCRGLYVFYGANRTGRFSSRLVQIQNLARNEMDELEEIRSAVKNGNLDLVERLSVDRDISDVLSQLVRTAFIPRKGYKFFVADFSSIEARVLAWLAGEEWKMKAFEEGQDLYCASASRMFRVPVEKNGKNKKLRQYGKQCELGCGYGGSVGALTSMGAAEMGMNDEEISSLVKFWRDSNPKIVKLWHDVDAAVNKAVGWHCKGLIKVRKVTFQYKKGMLFITLPSGRSLSYVRPQLFINRYKMEAVSYEGLGSQKNWERTESYGAKFVENITQGIARDILLYAMNNLKDFDIVAHVHDEVIIEAPVSVGIEEICKLMSKRVPWAPDLILDADGYVTDFYMKK